MLVVVGNSYSGVIQVLGGSLVMMVVECLFDVSVVQLVVGVQLQFGGSEIIVFLQVVGSVRLMGDLMMWGDQVYIGSLMLVNLAGFIFSGIIIDVSCSSNQFGGMLLGLVGGQVLVMVKEGFQFGNINLFGGGCIEVECLDFNGKLQLSGGSFSFVVIVVFDDVKVMFQGVVQVFVVGVGLVVVEVMVQQGLGSVISVVVGV